MSDRLAYHFAGVRRLVDNARRLCSTPITTTIPLFLL